MRSVELIKKGIYKDPHGLWRSINKNYTYKIFGKTDTPNRKRIYIFSSIAIVFLILGAIYNVANSKDYFSEITNLARGTYLGYSKDIMKNPVGMQPPQSRGTIYLNGNNLSKEYEHYDPLVAGTGVVIGYNGPSIAKEDGVIESQEIIWSIKNNRLVIIGDWTETTYGGTGTFNISPILNGENAGKIYVSLFTEYWKVWGYKYENKETFNKIVELFREYFKKTHNDYEPWSPNKPEENIQKNNEEELVNNTQIRRKNKWRYVYMGRIFRG